MSLHDHELILDENKRREEIEHNIVIDEEILEMIYEDNQSYEWQLKIRRCFLIKLLIITTIYNPKKRILYLNHEIKTIFHSYIKIIAVFWLIP